MAKISFFGVDGEEKSYTLHPQLTLRVGRDPGNDVVLRDPKVSRRHAEIVFERGFFVLHDLQSANGTYVNGVRVNVAPLTNGSELKLGSSHARFVDDAEASPRRETAPASEPVVAKRRTAEIPPDQLDGTFPHDKASGRAPEAAGPTSKEPRLREDTALVEEQQDDTPIADKKREALDPAELGGVTLDVQTDIPWGEVVTVRDEGSSKSFHYRRIFNVVALVAAIVAALVLFAGSIVATFLAVEKHSLLAAVAVSLTLLFTGGILLLVPKRHVHIFGDEALSRLVFAISEESIFGLPIVTFRVRLSDGSTVGFLTKNLFLSIVRRRWDFLDTDRRKVGYAVELGAGRPFCRKFLGDFFGLFTTDYAVMLTNGARAGAYYRRQPRGTPRRIELPSSRPDPRLALAFALLLDTIEKAR
ncbi:MAG: FHA domain-containing protein [Acidobacteria bacterium]|nr:FHA domain-containing protein [Acidobacteriota bacterium]